MNLNGEDIRQPNRFLHLLRGNKYIFIGILCFMTLIGAPLYPIFAFIALIHYRRAWRYPVTKVQCPYCETKSKVETVVTEFPCRRCHETIIKVGEEWRLEDESKLKHRY